MITAIIPARGGSKRLPDKNIKKLGGRPLVFYSLDSVINQPEIGKVIFTSDSEKYIDLVKREYGELVVIERRPSDYASDTAKVHEEVVRLKNIGAIDTEWFMLCLPTAPFRSHSTVERIVNAWRKDGEARFSAARYDFPTQFSFDIDQCGRWIPDTPDSPMVTGDTRSQDIPTRYRPTGAVYLQRTSTLGHLKTFYLEALPFLTDKQESMDVDTELDFRIAEITLELKGVR